MELHSWHKWDSAGLRFYKAWNLDKSDLVTHGFTTRVGGESQSPFDTLNLGLHVGDDSATVIRNRTRCINALGLDPHSLTTAEQIHGSRVAVVGRNNAGRGSVDFSAAIPGVDALITNVPEIALGLFFADCVPVLVLDPANKAIGLAHAGWKGTAAGVVTETLDAMASEFGTKPADCQAAVGPAIGRCCYEVGHEVANAIFKACADQRPLARGSDGKLKVDLQVANWCLLRQAGVPEECIAVCMRCTCCNAEEFFSYRRDGETGRMMAIMALRESG
jgi:YfiH family protein